RARAAPGPRGGKTAGSAALAPAVAVASTRALGASEGVSTAGGVGPGQPIRVPPAAGGAASLFAAGERGGAGAPSWVAREAADGDPLTAFARSRAARLGDAGPIFAPSCTFSFGRATGACRGTVATVDRASLGAAGAGSRWAARSGSSAFA